MNNPTTLHQSGHSSMGSRREGSLPGALRAILVVPLFWKIVLANAVFMTVVVIVTTVALSRPGHDSVEPGVLVVLLLGTLLAATVVNAWLVALALWPLEGITQTADAVRLGDLSARVPRSDLSDYELDRLGRVMNEMLEGLARGRERQRELSYQVLLAEERERERIAGELYAGTAQTLAGVLVRLQIILRRTPEDGSRPPLEELTSEIRAALEEVRAFARRLRPPELDELGVRAALEAHARGLASAKSPRITFSGSFVESRLPEDARLALFRVVQEALTNAVRHSGAKEVRVGFVPGESGLEVEVEDDGRGFDPAEPENDSPAHLGLLTMTERAGYAQGTIHVDSAPGSGTRIRLVLPWNTGSPDDAGDPPEELLPGLLRATGTASGPP